MLRGRRCRHELPMGKSSDKGNLQHKTSEFSPTIVWLPNQRLIWDRVCYGETQSRDGNCLERTESHTLSSLVQGFHCFSTLSTPANRFCRVAELSGAKAKCSSAHGMLSERTNTHGRVSCCQVSPQPVWFETGPVCIKATSRMLNCFFVEFCTQNVASTKKKNPFYSNGTRWAEWIFNINIFLRLFCGAGEWACTVWGGWERAESCSSQLFWYSGKLSPDVIGGQPTSGDEGPSEGFWNDVRPDLSVICLFSKLICNFLLF